VPTTEEVMPQVEKEVVEASFEEKKPSTQIVKVTPTRELTYEERFAVAVYKSGFFDDIDSAAAALVKIQAGKELGIGPAASLRAIQIINGQPCPGANTMLALVDRSYPRYDYAINERTAKRAEVTWYKNGHERGKTSFTLEEAGVAGLLRRFASGKETTWHKYPAAMLLSRAIAIGFRLYCGSLALGGAIYTPDELGGEEDINELEKLPREAGSNAR
jgi:hypothetical protein